MTLSDAQALTAFTQAQRDLAVALSNLGNYDDSLAPALRDVENIRQAAFANSAIACSIALEKGLGLQTLADANRLAVADLAPTAPKGTLYVSVSACSYHGYTGDLLRLRSDPQRAAVIPTQAQAAVIKANRTMGVRALRAALREGTQQAAMAALERMIAEQRRVARDNEITRASAHPATDDVEERLRWLVSVADSGWTPSPRTVRLIRKLAATWAGPHHDERFALH